MEPVWDPAQVPFWAFSSLSVTLACPSLICLFECPFDSLSDFFPISLSILPPPRPPRSSAHKINKPKTVPICSSALDSLPFSHFAHRSAAHTRTHPQQVRMKTMTSSPLFIAVSLPALPSRCPWHRLNSMPCSGLLIRKLLAHKTKGQATVLQHSTESLQ